MLMKFFAKLQKIIQYSKLFTDFFSSLFKIIYKSLIIKVKKITEKWK